MVHVATGGHGHREKRRCRLQVPVRPLSEARTQGSIVVRLKFMRSYAKPFLWDLDARLF